MKSWYLIIVGLSVAMLMLSCGNRQDIIIEMNDGFLISVLAPDSIDFYPPVISYDSIENETTILFKGSKIISIEYDENDPTFNNAFPCEIKQISEIDSAALEQWKNVNERKYGAIKPLQVIDKHINNRHYYVSRFITEEGTMIRLTTCVNNKSLTAFLYGQLANEDLVESFMVVEN